MGRILAVALIALTACTPGTGARSADDDVSEYGGSRDVYAGILVDSNCDSLQASFDQASANHDASVAGSDQARWALGYMTAAQARMEAVGC